MCIVHLLPTTPPPPPPSTTLLTKVVPGRLVWSLPSYSSLTAMVIYSISCVSPGQIAVLGVGGYSNNECG